MNVALIVVDGFGLNPLKEGNAIVSAKPKNLTEYWNYYPKTSLLASGDAVGLSWGEVGNSETGHMNLGAGRIVFQDFSRINNQIEDNSFFKNQKLNEAVNHVKKNNSTLHLFGIFSPGGVHGHMNHLFALLKFAKEQKVPHVALHLISDGRDSPQKSILQYLPKLEATIKNLNLPVVIASISGRYFAMDRDNRWDRTEKTYTMLTQGSTATASNVKDAVESSYKQNINDEFIVPTSILSNGKPTVVKNEDALIFYNYRSDRARQIISALAQKNFIRFDRKIFLEKLLFVIFIQGNSDIPNAQPAFSPNVVERPLAFEISQKKLSQVHIAETEKYAHVTYFFNGGIETAYDLEQRILIPSPKVATYDQKPEMSAEKITQEAISQIKKEFPSLIVINFANPDMVGHTGDYKATEKAINFVDKAIGEIIKIVLDNNGIALITADHGNAEQMIDPITKEIDKEHTTNPVPCILIDQKKRKKTADDIDLSNFPTPIGILGDVTPTILDLLSIPKNELMTGISLIDNLS